MTNNKTDLQKLIEEIDNTFGRSEVRNPSYVLYKEEWQLLHDNMPRELIIPKSIPPQNSAMPGLIGAPIIDRSEALKIASLPALKKIVEDSQMGEPEWRAVLCNLITRIEAQDKVITDLSNMHP